MKIHGKPGIWSLKSTCEKYSSQKKYICILKLIICAKEIDLIENLLTQNLVDPKILKGIIMQTPAEKYLIEIIKKTLNQNYEFFSDKAKLINIGGGRSTVIEDNLINGVFQFISDRVDVEDIKFNNSFVGNFFRCSVEFMPHVKSGEYDVAFANYVLEHVRDINMAASEILRILKPGGIFVTSIPNPQAPEFVVSRLTPLWFHKIIRKRESWETYYSYESIKQLSKIFNKAGFEMVDVLYWSFSYGYLNRFPVINRISCVYDKLMDFLKLKHFMNNVCIVLKKPLK